MTVEYTNVKILDRLCDNKFIGNIVELLKSEDRKEREYVKNIIHNIYNRLISKRILVRKLLSYSLLEYIYETHEHSGIEEILLTFIEIFRGLSQPIKNEYASILTKSILPLYKLPRIEEYDDTLFKCITVFLEKGCNYLIVVLFHFYLRFLIVF